MIFLKSVGKYFFKNKLNLFFSFLLPTILIILATCTFTFTLNLSSSTSITLLAPIYILPTISLIGILCLNCLSLPLLIIEFRKKDFFKRVFLVNFNKWKVVLNLTGFYILVSIIFYFFSFLLSCAIICMIDVQNAPFILYLLQHGNYFEILYSILIASILASSIGLFLGTIVNNPLTCEIVGLFLILIMMFLGGAGIPLQMIYINSSDFIWDLTFISPFHSSAMNLNEAWCQGYVTNGNINSSIFDPSTPFITNLVPPPQEIWNNSVLMKIFWTIESTAKVFNFADFTDKIINLVLPYGYIILLIGISLKFFKIINKE